MLPNAFGCGIVQAPAGQNLPTSQQNHNFTFAVHEAAHTIAVLIQCQIAASAMILAELPFELVLHVHVSDVSISFLTFFFYKKHASSAAG